jgi:hypothetical protein
MPWKEGGLYCIPSDDGSYGIVKVLKVDSVGVHIRRYSNRFDQPPAQVEESELLLGAFDADADGGFGVGHCRSPQGRSTAGRPRLCSNQRCSLTSSPATRDGWKPKAAIRGVSLAVSADLQPTATNR